MLSYNPWTRSLTLADLIARFVRVVEMGMRKTFSRALIASMAEGSYTAWFGVPNVRLCF